MPVYKPEPRWLDSAVRSIVRVAENAGCKMELCLGDDGSPDDCFKLLAGYEKEFPEIVRAFHFPENRGVGATSCALVDRCSGRYVASFDQDDILLPFDVDRVVKFMDSHPEYSASYARKFLFNDRGLTGDVHGDAISSFLQFFQPKLNINAMLIRRDVLLAHDNFCPLPYSRINHDIWLMCRLAEDTFYHFDAEYPRALYRVHGAQSSTNHGDGQQDWQLIGQYLISKHAELYREIVFGKEIPSGGNALEEQLISGLCGLALFLNQKNPALMWRMVNQCVDRHPDDYGARGVLLQMLKNDQAGFDAEYRRAIADFAGDPRAQYSFAVFAMEAARLHGGATPELLAQFNELYHQSCDPPPIVTDNLPKIKRQSYSWSMPGIKI